MNDGGRQTELDDSGYIYQGGFSAIPGGNGGFLLIKYDTQGDTLWKRLFGASANMRYSFWCMKKDVFGNIYMTGTRYTNHINIIVVKYNAAGTLIWENLYEPQNVEDWPLGIAVDLAGNVYIAGYTMTAGSWYDVLLLKYNSSGELAWTQTYNGPVNGNDYGYGISVDHSGNIIVTGDSEASSLWDAIILKYDPNGSLLWSRRYNFPNNAAIGICVTTDIENNIYIGGTIGNGGLNRDFLTVKYDKKGILLWQVFYAGPSGSFDQISAITIDNQQNVFVTGIAVHGSTKYTTIKYNSSGQQQWLSVYNEYSGSPNSIALDNFGNVYVTGQSTNSNSNYDILTVKYDANGSQQWVHRYNGNGNEDDQGYSINIDQNNNVYVGGYIKEFNNLDAILMKFSYLTPIITGTSDFPSVYKLYQNYPNPFNPSTKIRFDVLEKDLVTLSIFDLNGREIEKYLYNLENSGTFETEINLSKYSSGIYFYRITTNNFSDTKKMILLK